MQWRGVPGAEAYVLEISANLHFASHIQEKEYSETTAGLELRDDGSFYWHVAALGADDVQGPWSRPRTFHVLSRALE